MNVRLIIGGVAVVVAAILLAACDESAPPQSAPIIPSPATNPAPSPPLIPNRPAVEPTTPIKMEKPRLLGPVAPAIVEVPEQMPEPTIRVRLTAEEDAPPYVDHHKYRGTIQTIQLPTGKYVAINVVPIESYLTGVLARELYGSWTLETYKTQAVAARTFALYQMLTVSKEHLWDVNNDESSQMYGGIKGETAKSRSAVAATRGMVLTAKWKNQTGIFCTFYSACTGGATQDPWDAWGDMPVSPLAARKVGAIDESCPKYNWPTMTLSKLDMSRAIQSWGQRNSIAYLATLGLIRNVQIAKRNAITGRPTELTLTNAGNRSVPIRAEEFRQAMIYDPTGAASKPPSSFFGITDAGDAILLTHGRGYGHGIGMSQWGAQALALDGYSAGKILAFYYPGSTAKNLW